MNSLYTYFKILFGIIISIFILVIIATFLGGYVGIQEDAQHAQVVTAFLKSSGDVMTTGNSLSFSGFAQDEFLVSFSTTPPEGIITPVGTVPVYFPLFFTPGEQVFISRGTLDLGFWTFSFVQALPRTRILFTVRDPSSWDLVADIVDALPSTEFFEPKVTFGFCDGSQLQENLCANFRCEQEDFLFHLLTPQSTHSSCLVTGSQDTVLITISPSCAGTSSICLEPQGIKNQGNIYLAGKLVGLYKDPVDIVAIIIGGVEEDAYGKSGISLFEYKNNILRKELLLATDILSTRAQLIQKEYALDAPCHQAFESFRVSMITLSQALPESYYLTISSVDRYHDALDQAQAAHESLREGGCDY